MTAPSRSILLVMLLWAAASAGADAPHPARPDSNAVESSIDEPWRLRGTVEPLQHESSSGRDLLRMAARVPYAAVWLVAAPPIAVIGWDEEHGYSRKVMSWFTRDVQVVNTTVAAFLGYETGFGVTVLGVRIHSRNWYGTGLENRFRFSYLNPSKNIVELKLSGPLSDDGLSFNTRTRFRRTPGRDFYGFGMTPDAPESDYDSQLLLNEFQVRRPMTDLTDGGLLLYSRATRLREHDDESLHVAEPALWARAARNHYAGFEADVRRDTRDRGEMSSRGSLMRLSAGWNLALEGDDSHYTHVTAEYQWHRPLFRDRILAFRVAFEDVAPDDASRLPFTELRGLGGSRTLRGYHRDRFVDQTQLAASLEYRYPVTKLIQGRLFGDWGTVAPQPGDLDLGDLAWSAGLALAVQLGDDDMFVIQYAHGPEGGHAYVGTKTPFGFDSRRKR